MTIGENNPREFGDRRGDLDVESVGPFDEFRLVVNGWTVPHLQAQNKRDGGVYVSLDGRFGLDLPDDTAGAILSFMADVIAVAKGFPCHPRGDDGPFEPMLPWHRLRPLSGLGGDGGT